MTALDVETISGHKHLSQGFVSFYIVIKEIEKKCEQEILANAHETCESL